MSTNSKSNAAAKPRMRTWIIAGGVAVSAGVLAYVFLGSPVNPAPTGDQGSITADTRIPPAGNLPAVTSAPGEGATQNASIQPGVTAADLATLERIKSYLRDAGFRQVVTAQQLSDMPEVQNLPKELRRQLLNEVMDMLRRGELDQKIFLAQSENFQPVSQGNAGGIQPANPDLSAAQQAAPEAAPTPAQLQAAESVRSQLRDPRVASSLTMQQLQAMPETQDLPSSLRQQLVSEVMGMLQRGELDPKKFYGRP